MFKKDSDINSYYKSYSKSSNELLKISNKINHNQSNNFIHDERIAGGDKENYRSLSNNHVLNKSSI